LESRKYEFVVNGTMPVLEFELAGGKEKEDLHLELYNPLSNEIFEAKFGRGRIEVDRDGSITYFTRSTDHVNVSLFLGRNLTITLGKDGDVLIRTPSRIVSVEKEIQSGKHDEFVTSDSVRLKLA
jgi:hypothetical protein